MAKLFKFLSYTISLCMFLSLTMARSENSTIHSRKLDEGNMENKCGSCPCNNPCNPPPSPPPPPPSPPPPVKPPPSPPVTKCPPPPCSGGCGGGGGGQYYPPNPPYIYINGPPGNLYPVDPYYSGSSSRFLIGFVPLSIVVLAMMELLQ